MHAIYQPANPLKRRNENSIREEEFFGLFNGETFKRLHSNKEDNYNICNKSLEYLPSFHMEANDRSMNQNGQNDLFFNDYFIFPNANKINFKLEEFLEIASDETNEDSFVKDFPQAQDNFTDIYLYWEYEEDDINLVREIFYFNEWSSQRESHNSNKMFFQTSLPINTKENLKENFKKMPDLKNPWLEKINRQIGIGDIDVRYFLMGQIFKMMNEEHPIINIS